MKKQLKLFGSTVEEDKDNLAEYSKDFFEKFSLERSPKNIDDIHKAFTALRDQIHKGNVEACLIGKYIYEHISRKEIRKRRVTARDFEEFLVTFFNGNIIEAEQRNQYLKELSGSDEFSRRVSRNRLEKLDVVLGSILLSVKTFVPTNKELNAGSFSAEALFQGFLPLPIPSERTDLGSPRALEEKFTNIQSNGQWDNFVRRFETMVNTIYLTDWIFTIKGGQVFDIFLLSKNDFKRFMIDAVKGGPSKAVEFLNRFEAHAIRTRRNPLLSKAKHISINLIGPIARTLGNLDEMVNEIRSITIATLVGKVEPKEAQNTILKRVGEFFKEIGY